VTLTFKADAHLQIELELHCDCDSDTDQSCVDPQKREAYDRYGEEGELSAGGMNPDELFSQFFGGGGFGRRGPTGPKRGKDVVHTIKVSLEDLYKGKTTKLALQKQILCRGCDGRGGKAGSVSKCKDCNGQGVKIGYRQMGPMVQQVQQHCQACSGKGEIIPDKDRCKDCRGSKVSQERKVLEVHVDPGMKQGDKVVFKDDADQAPDVIPGDVIIVLEQKPHAVFQREGDDLMCNADIELVTALTGGQFTITHLDGRTLLVTIPQGEVIKPGN